MSSSFRDFDSNQAWTPGRRFLLRVVFVFFALISLPLDPSYWGALFTANWTQGRFEDLFLLATWVPRFLPEGFVSAWGLASFANLGIALLLAVLAGGAWSALGSPRTDDDKLYYWLRVLVRYRLAVALLAYGVIKLIPLQFPEPTLSDLHTPYGDFLLWKIYALTNGVAVAGYQTMLGAVEILAALLLLDRRTATIGAGVGAAMLINIVLVNFAYELGDHVHAVSLLLLASFLLAHDTPRLYQLLVRQRPARAERFEPVFSRVQHRLRKVARGVIAAWVSVFAISAYAGYRSDAGLFPRTEGLPGVKGLYRVVSPANESPALPWKNVVFEAWNTVSVAPSNGAVVLDGSIQRIETRPDDRRNYEQAGNGGRRFYSYTFDPAAETIELLAKDGSEERLSFKYRLLAEGQLELAGRRASGETHRVFLERVEKRQLIHEGRRRPVTLQSSRLPAMSSLIAPSPVSAPGKKGEQTNPPPSSLGWTPWQRVLFRFAFITIALVIVPLTASWYQRLFNLSSPWALFGLLSGYRTDFISLTSDSGKWGWGGFAAWGVAALGGAVGAAIWTLLARRSTRTEYNTLHYWLRLVVRYRLALGLLGFGFMKLYPTQMPYPSNANLLTNLGDYTTFKLYWQAVGVVTWYQIVIGILEVGTAVLFFFRGTTALASVITIGVLGNIAHANVAYDGGVHVYSAFFAVLSAFLLIPYAVNVWNLLVRRKDVVPAYREPRFDGPVTRRVHLAVKASLVFLFTVGYGYERYEAYYVKGLRKEPLAKAIPGIEGVYDVTEFSLNGQVIPSSSPDDRRWHRATFERYTTLAYQVNRPAPIFLANGAPALRDSEKRYELAGVAGGWRYLHYVADEKAGTLVVQNRNNDENAIAGRRGGGIADGSRPEQNVNRLTWSYSRPTADRVIIEGRDVTGDEIRVVLDHEEREFPLQRSRAAVAR